MTARILIIEDNRTNMELMVYLLTAFGYQLDTAADGCKGIERALSTLPDLVICDLEMPVMSGYEVVKHLRDRIETKPIPMIAVTAYAMVGDRDKILAAGFDGYVSKPIYPETFVKEVESFLPAEKRPPRVPQPHNRSPQSRARSELKNMHVLVVDDSPTNLSLIRSTLEPSGYDVVAVSTVDAAMIHARRGSFDLILSDLHMSPESGLGFLRQVKADPHLRSIPFVLFTSSRSDPNDGMQERAIALGVERFLSRPIAPEQLLEELETCLTRPKIAEQ